MEKLLASLNLPTQEEIERLWAEEAERRVSEIDKGKVNLVPGEKVFSEVRARYRKGSRPLKETNLREVVR